MKRNGFHFKIGSERYDVAWAPNDDARHFPNAAWRVTLHRNQKLWQVWFELHEPNKQFILACIKEQVYSGMGRRAVEGR